MTKFNLAFPFNQQQLLRKYLLAFPITFLFFISIPISSYAACTSEISTASEHKTNDRATSKSVFVMGLGFVTKYYANNDDGSVASNEISSSGNTTLYQGSDGNWYITDPEDCDSTEPESEPESTPVTPNPSPATTLNSGSGIDGDGVRPNIILAMNDSFLMNSEVLWTAASGQSELIDLSRLNEMFVNRKIFAMLFDSSTTDNRYTPDYDYAPPSGQFGAGKLATSIKYNLLAYNPNATYTPWPGYPSKDMAQCNSVRSTISSSNTPDENNNCPKYFPEDDNTLEGSDCSNLNSGSPTNSSKYCTPRNCLGTGCEELVAISPNTTYEAEIGGFKESGGCGVLYTHKLGGSNYGGCVQQEYRDSIWGRLENSDYPFPTAAWPSPAISQISDCNKNGWGDAVCFNDDGTSTTAYATICYNLFPNKQIWPCSTYMENTLHTNILRKGQLESQYYVDPDGSTVVYVASLTAEQLNNYANWFTYYRTLGHVQKAAMLAVAYEAKDNDRLALADSNGITTNINTMSSGTHRADLSNSIAIKRTSFTTLSNNILNTLDKTYTYLNSNKKYLYEGMAVDSSDLSANCRQNHTLMFTSGFWNDPIEPSSANGSPSDAPVFGSDALSNVAKFMLGDLDSNLEDKVPVDAYSTISVQHIKTWVMQFDIDNNSDYDYGVQPSFSAPVNTSSNTLKRDDIGYSSRAGNGGYQKIENAGTAMSAATNLLSQMTTGGTMCPSVTDCGDSSGKRISWKELQKQ